MLYNDISGLKGGSGVQLVRGVQHTGEGEPEKEDSGDTDECSEKQVDSKYKLIFLNLSC